MARGSEPTLKNAWIAFEGLTNQVHGFCTTRHHGVSDKPFDSLNLGDHVGDDPSRVSINRQRLAQWLPDAPTWVRQVHGNSVLVVDGPLESGVVEADALVTTARGRVLGILTADCMSVVICDDAGTVLGLAHAGWRGLVGGVLQAAVVSMRQQVGTLGRWRAWIGPCISARAFQVGDDVREEFLAFDSSLAAYFTPDDAPHKWRCDLPGIAKAILLGMGAVNVTWCGLCTVNDRANRFFSYRRDGQTGRMATVAWLD